MSPVIDLSLLLEHFYALAFHIIHGVHSRGLLQQLLFEGMDRLNAIRW